MSTTTVPDYSQQFAVLFKGNPQAYTQFMAIVANSKLLLSLLDTFFKDNTKSDGTRGLGTIMVSGSAGDPTESPDETATSGIVISISQSLIDNYLTGPKANATTMAFFADALAHELGHALLPNGQGNPAKAADPDAAIQAGILAEGAAAVSEYVVAEELGLKQRGKPAQFSDTNGGLTATLTNSNLINWQQDTSIGALEEEPQLSAEESLAGSIYQNYAPSGSGNSTYKTNWLAEWSAANLLGPLGNIDLANIQKDAVTEGGNSVSGWSITGNNVQLQAGAAGATIATVAGEMLSFSATWSPQDEITNEVETVTLGIASTIVGGHYANDVVYGLPGTDTYYIGPSVGGSSNTIVCNPSGAGAIYEGGLGSTNLLGTAPIHQVAPNVWSDGQQQYQFIPLSQIPLADWQGINVGNSGINFLPSLNYSDEIGELVVTNYGNNDGVLKLLGFNLTQAEDSPGGFLGITLPTIVSILPTQGTRPTVPLTAGTSDSFTIGLGVPQTTAQEVAVTLQGASGVDFEVVVNGQTEQIGAGGVFSVAVAADQSSATFSLEDVASGNSSSDLSSGGTLTLSAALAGADLLNLSSYA